MNPMVWTARDRFQPWSGLDTPCNFFFYFLLRWLVTAGFNAHCWRRVAYQFLFLRFAFTLCHDVSPYSDRPCDPVSYSSFAVHPKYKYCFSTCCTARITGRDWICDLCRHRRGACCDPTQGNGGHRKHGRNLDILNRVGPVSARTFDGGYTLALPVLLPTLSGAGKGRHTRHRPCVQVVQWQTSNNHVRAIYPVTFQPYHCQAIPRIATYLPQHQQPFPKGRYLPIAFPTSQQQQVWLHNQRMGRNKITFITGSLDYAFIQC